MDETMVFVGVSKKVQSEQGQIHYERNPIGDVFKKIGKEIQSLIQIPGSELPESLLALYGISSTSKDDLYMFAKLNPKSKGRGTPSNRS